MKATDAGALDDIPGRLADLDQEGIDVQVLYPTTLLAIPFIRDKDYATALCRAYHNYVADRIKGQDRLKAVAVVPIQDPPSAIAEMRRAVQELGFVGVMITPVVGDGHNIKTLDAPEFFPFFEAADRLNVAVGLHSVAAAYDLPWQNIFDKFFYTHSVAHPFSQMIGLMTIIGGGLLERLPNIRVAILECGCSWLPYWTWWLDGHYKDPRFLKDPKSVFGEDPLPYLTREPRESITGGRLYVHAHEAEPLRPVIEMGLADQLLYASDYPHEDAGFPGSVKEFKERTDLSEEVKAKILGGNARRLYRLAVGTKKDRTE
ncbi:MAG: amidohydrolase [Nitrospinae bacterium]|nr:amidohydrolase [Nitrospinota bacterium]